MTTLTISLSASDYSDNDDCLTAAAEDYVSRHPEAEGYDLDPRWATEEREAILLDVPVRPKSEVSRWTTVATYVATYDNGDDEGACDVEVQIGEVSDAWYVRTSDDAGGSDEADDTVYATREEAETAAEELAAANDESDGEQDAEAYLRSRLTAAAGEPCDDGEWCVYWESACAEDEGPRGRYATQEQAEAAVELANADLNRRNPGGNLLCGFVARELVDGVWLAPQ